MKKTSIPKQFPVDKTLTLLRQWLPGGHEFGNEFYVANDPNNPGRCIIVLISSGKWQGFKMSAADAIERLWNPDHVSGLRKHFTDS